MVLDARRFRALPPLDANGTTTYIQDSSARSGQDRRGGTVAGAFPDTPELLPGKLVTSLAKLGRPRPTRRPAGEALRVRVAAPPAQGRANAAILGYLAGLVGLRARDLEITAGERARDKLVLVRGRSPRQVRAALLDP